MNWNVKSKMKKDVTENSGKSNRKKDIAIEMIHWLLMVLLPAVSFYLMELYEHNPFTEVRPKAQLFNIILMELIAWLLFILIGNARVAIRIQWGIAMVFGLINHYVMAFRSTPFVPWDIYSIKTAASVAQDYDFTPDARVVVVTLTFLLVMLLVHFVRLRIDKKIYIRAIPAAAVFLTLAVFVHALQNEEFQIRNYLYPYLFTPGYMTKVNGMAVTFSMDLAYLVVDRPSGYQAKQSAETLEEYNLRAEEEKNGSEDYPNIIVIMNEAFSDVGILGNLSTNVDYMPFVHKLQEGYENTITGTLNVSVCGGNTANTEFEFLTGNTMRFFPNGSIPYQQYLKNPVDNLAAHLDDLGYASYGVHPYNADGWNRDKVYPLLGFHRFDSLKDFVAPRLLRKYVSDESNYEKIKKIYESKPENVPAFIFNVTMQNHGSYTEMFQNFTPNVQVAGSDSVALAQYLSLIRQSDQELEELFSYFENCEERTVICFFGDHQPADSVIASIPQSKNPVSGLTEEQLRYQVPYVIWANYDIEEKSGQETSANYLAAETLQAAGVPLSGYQKFLLEIKNYYPVISSVRCDGSDEEKLSEYQQMQYYQMFDKEEQDE